jgi:hypothetical protein
VSFSSKLKIESKGVLAASTFYALAGIIFLISLVMASFAIHLGIIGIFSLITAFGIFRKRSWAIYFVLILFFVGTTFSTFTIYYTIAADTLLGISALVYLILIWIFTGYAVLKRKTFET